MMRSIGSEKMEVCVEKEEDSNWKLTAGISTLGWCVVGWIASTPTICVHPLNHRGQWVTVNLLQIGSRAEQANNNCYKVNIRYDTTSRKRICEWHLAVIIWKTSTLQLSKNSSPLWWWVLPAWSQDVFQRPPVCLNANYTQALAPCD